MVTNKLLAGIDFNKTFSSTTQIRTFRFFLALATELDLDITQYDVSNAFLNGFLEEPVFTGIQKRRISMERSR